MMGLATLVQRWRARRTPPVVRFLNRGEQFEFTGPAGEFTGECAWTDVQSGSRLIVYVPQLQHAGVAGDLPLARQREIAGAVRDTLAAGGATYRIDLVES
jgi:hypothetical protein